MTDYSHPVCSFRNGMAFRFDEVIVLILVCVAGHVSFTEGGRHEVALLLTAGLFLLLLLDRRKDILVPRFCLVMSCFVAVFLLQALAFSRWSLVTWLGFFVRLFVGYAAVRLVRNFPLSYIRVMYAICIYSLLFYIPDQAGQYLNIGFRELFRPLHNLLGIDAGWRYDAFVYNFQVGHHRFRNAAFFWEPGAFAGFIHLALVFLALMRPSLMPRVYRRMLILFFLCLLTTFSTMGYYLLPLSIVLHVISGHHWVSHGLWPALGKGMVVALIAAMALASAGERFLIDEVKSDIERVQDRAYYWENSRLGSIIFDWKYIRQRPLTGWGMANETRYMLDPDLKSGGSTNGVTDFTVKVGLMGMALFLWTLWKGLAGMAPSHLWQIGLGFAIIVLTLNGESFLNYSLYLGLMFMKERA